VGLARARELLFLGERVSAEEAVRLGLANRVVPGGKLRDEAMDLARRLATLPRNGTACTPPNMSRSSPGSLRKAAEGSTLVSRRKLDGRDVRRPDSATPAVASWIQADAGVSAETFGKCLTQLHLTSPRKRLASDVPFSMPFPERKIQGRHSAERPVVRAAPTAGAPGTTARGRLAPRLNPQPRQSQAGTPR
jgi:hypothetical protein